MEVTPSGWFIREDPIEMDDLGVPRFIETPIYIYMYIYIYVVYIYILGLEMLIV